MKNNKQTKDRYNPIPFDPKAYAQSERASNPANAAHLMESIAQLKACKTQTHKLAKMTANMQAGDLTIDADFENMPPAGRELI